MQDTSGDCGESLTRNGTGGKRASRGASTATRALTVRLERLGLEGAGGHRDSNLRL